MNHSPGSRRGPGKRQPWAFVSALQLRPRERAVLLGILLILLVGSISRHFYLKNQADRVYDAPVFSNR